MYSNFYRFICLQSAFILLLFSHASVAQLVPVPVPTVTVYEMLKEFNFPPGILPTNIIGYTLDRLTGEFVVSLAGKCEFLFDGYYVMYSQMVSGVITANKITMMRGVSVRLYWFMRSNVKSVIRDGDDVRISAGVFEVDFDVENFIESPKCSCGFDCGDDDDDDDDSNGQKRLDWFM